jgi:hypothetical protein
VVDEEVDLGCTSAPELTRDAGTPETLGAGVLGRFSKSRHTFCAPLLFGLRRDGSASGTSSKI